MTLPLHVHSFGPRGRGQCSCGMVPGETDDERVRREHAEMLREKQERARVAKGWCEHCDQTTCLLTSQAAEQARSSAHSIASMHPSYRAHLLAELAHLQVCLLCGADAPCYCDPCYDE